MQAMRVKNAIFILVMLMLAACGNANTANNSKVGPSIYDAPLGSNAVLLNDTGMNPRAGTTGAPVAGGCLVRFTNISGNDINCSNAALYANQTACQLNPYYGYANFLVQSCPAGNLIGRCIYPDHTMYYYAGYQIISPNTPLSALVTGCTTSGGAWL